MLRYMYITSLIIAMNTDYFPKNCGQRYSRTGVSASTSVFLLNIFPPITHTHLYLNRCQKDKRASYGKLQTDLCSFACREAVDRKLSELEDRKPVKTSLFLLWFDNPSGTRVVEVQVTRSHSDTPHSVGLFWTSDRTVAETYNRQLTTLTRDKLSCPRGIRTRSPSK